MANTKYYYFSGKSKETLTEADLRSSFRAIEAQIVHIGEDVLGHIISCSAVADTGVELLRKQFSSLFLVRVDLDWSDCVVAEFNNGSLDWEQVYSPVDKHFWPEGKIAK